MHAYTDEYLPRSDVNSICVNYVNINDTNDNSSLNSSQFSVKKMFEPKQLNQLEIFKNVFRVDSRTDLKKLFVVSSSFWDLDLQKKYVISGPDYELLDPSKYSSSKFINNIRHIYIVSEENWPKFQTLCNINDESDEFVEKKESPLLKKLRKLFPAMLKFFDRAQINHASLPQIEMKSKKRFNFISKLHRCAFALVTYAIIIYISFFRQNLISSVIFKTYDKIISSATGQTREKLKKLSSKDFYDNFHLEENLALPIFLISIQKRKKRSCDDDINFPQNFTCYAPFSKTFREIEPLYIENIDRYIEFVESPSSRKIVGKVLKYDRSGYYIYGNYTNETSLNLVQDTLDYQNLLHDAQVVTFSFYTMVDENSFLETIFFFERGYLGRMEAREPSLSYITKQFFSGKVIIVLEIIHTILGVFFIIITMVKVI